MEFTECHKGLATFLYWEKMASKQKVAKYDHRFSWVWKSFIHNLFYALYAEILKNSGAVFLNDWLTHSWWLKNSLEKSSAVRKRWVNIIEKLQETK
jgi:hypothetical protein